MTEMLQLSLKEFEGAIIDYSQQLWTCVKQMEKEKVSAKK